MNQLHQVLNVEIANFNVLFTKLHYYHWYVKGQEFFTLHALFEKYYEEINEFYDEFAERLLTIGGKPKATLKEYLEITTLKEVDSKVTTSVEMVKDVLKDFNIIIDELKKGIEISGTLGDDVTQDMFISTKAKLEKHAWMLRAYL